jgi:hypothetical protein
MEFLFEAGATAMKLLKAGPWGARAGLGRASPGVLCGELGAEGQGLPRGRGAGREVKEAGPGLDSATLTGIHGGK